MLILLLFLAGLGPLTTAGLEAQTPLLQIIMPRKTRANASHGEVSEMHVTYVIKISGKTYTLQLEKQSFLDPHFLVFSYNESGKLLQDYSYIKGHCFYQGYVEEIPKSVLTLSTCSGLRGLLQLENVTYGMEPLESAVQYEHILYQIKNNKIAFSPLQENYPVTQFDNQSYRILVKSEKNSEVDLLKRNLKILIVMDKALFDYMGSEISIATEKVVHIFGLLNTIFSHFKMTVTLSYLEFWSDKNKISTDGNADDILQRFLSWKQKSLTQRSSDMAYFLIYRDHPNYVGATYHGMACNPNFAAGIALYAKSVTLEAFSVVIAQLLGISLGLTYDDVYNCYCPGTTCIMNPEAIHSHGVKFFSSCNMDEYKHTVSQPAFECLQIKTPTEMVSKVRRSTCGNGILESGEQCDCGLPENCRYKKCCDVEECRLIGSAECGSGPCCEPNSCLISERGKVCRKRRDLCDFTEYCNGITETCVPDTLSADLEPCRNNTAYCYGGRCRNTDAQCARLFGRFAKGASFLCYEEVNVFTDRFGSCYWDSCYLRNSMCGKLICHWSKTELIKRTLYDIQYTYYGGQVCVSLASTRNLNNKASDPTFVDNGTQCESEKYCLNGRCINRPPRRRCSPSANCSGHGVCNNFNHCHCDVGYAPPACESTPSSPGGSIDDGFWILSENGLYLPVRPRRRRAAQNNGLLISFYIFLPFLILTGIIALKWNKVKGLWNRIGTVSEGSTSEDSQSHTNMSYN
ncbi:A disintegrin and metallopeptidase domain 3-like isoform X1 [Dasypus novemcinctus]|uniref:A disintegrin and metallopeptidase domain 3-like isoform X1 n=1 Tax=Dasypus novemcinctus TaxID=9361 RepID=UPI00265DB1FF|nr:A disintegrin and metallopeptidase domain 3-like isoform X1 [Dasypus novemcinctus]